MDKVDLNKAFAENWDKKNPSDFKKKCLESQKLREDHERDKKRRETAVSLHVNKAKALPPFF